MSGIYYAIGGGNILNKETYNIDLDIIKEAKIENPIVLFIPAANNDREDTTNSFLNYYKEFTNNIIVLNLCSNKYSQNEVNELFDKADIIYLAGGKTERLFEVANKYKFKELIINAYNNNKIIAGISAGGILLFEQGFGDKDTYSYNGVNYGYHLTNGLGILKGIFCPHYNSDGIMVFNDIIKETGKDGYALSNGASLKITDNISVVKEKGASAFSLLKSNDYQLKPLK